VAGKVRKNEYEITIPRVIHALPSMKRLHIISAGYLFASLALFLFSYTQVDLNLTLSRVSVWQGIQKAFQYVGFYERPLALGLYIGIVSIFFILYISVLSSVKRGQISIKSLWKVIFLIAGLLVFSYPAAFSYDFFNYLFTAKTVLVYHQNPYAVTPLQFASIDPWTNFMRWTHLSSAYTPLWIGLSLIPYVIGFGYFITVLFATKWMIAGFYLLAAYMLMRTVEKVSPKYTSYALALFACNPLILIEALVSGHNDIVLVSFAMVSVFAYFSKQSLLSFWYLGLSIATKLMTIFLLPVYMLQKGRGWMVISMLIGVGLVLIRREFLPWYWVWVIPFVALNAEVTRLIRFMICVSLGLVLSYAPFIYFGEYSSLEQVWKTGLIWGGVGMGLITAALPIKKDSVA